ncbi:hypothetical protein AB0C18_11680 [Nonomuraea muscovyensis]|uniref:Uncharacterized protein n=1 Tax=Nonomuraea muscovyensis TaxID=1124761 RepID=A0A7X0C1E8_9ACTN|nr:hypothetical protein [Nonomuraea muscovyensis]MBB6346403.1 hypothetical protein [Nonomuraea muscovyensis]MDF2707879.1 hypothetical protein [Nonomuraea muscovyensis]
MALAFVGVTVYSVLNIVLGFVVLVMATSNSNDTINTGILVAGALVLALVGLGAGAGLLFVRRPWATGLGLGLMLGWALWSIVSAGYCTGLNPTMYG